MSKKLGELVVVAIKARNLNARDVIGKGDPFATFRIGDMAKRTKTDKRGGQHPVWDDELRFQIMDEQRHKTMKVQIYNEDKREHVLIGDEIIKLDEVFKSGEWDAWHEIKYRNKYAGEIFLEMTFYNAGIPPPVANPPQPTPVVQTPPQSSTPYKSPNSKPAPLPGSYPPPANSPQLQNTTPVGLVSQSTLPYSPQGNSAPYPPQGVSAPYPPQGTSAPYPPQGTSAPYPPQGASTPYPPTSAPYPLQTQTSAPYPPHGASSPYSPQTSAPYPPQAYPPPQIGGHPQPPQNGGPVSFPIPIPTPNAPASNGGYPQYNGGPQDLSYPNYPAQVQGGYQQPSYPPNNVYPPPNNQMYPPPNFGQGYPPTGGPY